MTQGPRPVDCVVVGGGPAGAVTAGLLARDGLAVVLADDGRPRRATPDETLLPAAAQALARIGVQEAVFSAGLRDPLRHLAIWGSAAIAAQPDDAGGRRLARGAFDGQLRGWARAQGADVREGARLCGGPPADGEGAITLQTADGAVLVLHARTTVLATGRGGRRGLAVRADAGPATAAFCVRGQGDPGFADAALIEAVPDGWLWWMPASDGTATVAVLTDADAARGIGSRRVVAQALAGARGPAASLRAPQLLHATRATAELWRPLGGAFVAGDAAGTIDPLASQGVEKAIASADHTAAAVRTVLQRPELKDLVCATRWRWERDLWLAHAATAAAFYRQEPRFANAPFWRARHAPGPEPSQPPAADLTLVRHPAAAAATGLRRAGDRFEPVAGLTRPGLDEVLTHVRFVPVGPVAAAFATPHTLAAGLAAAGADPRLFVLPRAAVRDAVLALWHAGLLIPATSAAASR